MSGTPPISGRLSKLRPAHYIVIILAFLLFLLAIPVVSNLTAKKKTAEATSAIQAAATDNGGEPWHPIDDTPKTTLVAARPAIDQPNKLPPNPLVSEQPPPRVTGQTGLPDMRMFGQRQAPPPAPTAAPDAANSGGSLTRPVAAEGSMGALLKPTETAGFVATRTAKPWAIIPEGTIIACNSVTPMTSELPGFVKAKVTYDVKSEDGHTILIDRNSDIFGEIGHGLAEGQERLFVLWRRIRTPAPDFVRITINSPAADELGEAGLSGDINTHTWRKIGGALLLSGVDALLQGVGAGIGSALSHGNSNNGNGNGSNLNFYQFQSQGQGLASSLLQHTVSIPDTLHRDQALPCSIFVSGDLDFSSVYELRRMRH